MGVPKEEGDAALERVKDKVKAAKGIHKLDGVTSKKLRENEKRGTFAGNTDDYEDDRGGPDVSSSRKR
jgi:hypothetical protein